MKKIAAWILALAAAATLASCAPTKGNTPSMTGTMVPTTTMEIIHPATPTPVPPDGTVTAPGTQAPSPPATKTTAADSNSGKSNPAIKPADASLVNNINQMISDAQQYLKDETLPDISTD